MVRTRGIPARIVHAWLAGNAGFAAGPGQRLPGGSTHHVLVLPGRERPSASRAIRIPAEVNLLLSASCVNLSEESDRLTQVVPMLLQ